MGRRSTKRRWFILAQAPGQYEIYGAYSEATGEQEDPIIEALNANSIHWQYVQIDPAAGDERTRTELVALMEGEGRRSAKLSTVAPEVFAEYKGELPRYAASADRSRLLKVFCRTCRCSRWATLNTTYPGKEVVKNAQMGEYTATCLQCGKKAIDNYNWPCRGE